MAQRQLILVAVLAALVAAYILGPSACQGDPEPPEGNVAARLALPVFGGGAFDPAALDGKRVLLNFWRPG